MNKYVILMMIVLLLASCTIEGGDTMDRLDTTDQVGIAYAYVEASGNKGVILLHMLNQNKESWGELPAQLQAAGFSSIAIDFRGHGESDGDWQQFSEDEFRAMVSDVAAAKEFLESKGKTEVSVVGGSIGANTAFNFATNDVGVKTVILLAPGENYRGVGTLESAATFNEGRHVLVVVAEDDRYFETGKKVFDAIVNDNKELKVYAEGGHGTRLLPVSDLREVIVEWLERYG